ncbi:MAG: hypothetical protein AAGC60_15195 [Acidobacteriota bacterium]
MAASRSTPDSVTRRSGRSWRSLWRRGPWAGLATLLLVLALDRVALAPDGPLWQRWERPARDWSPATRGIVADRKTLRELREIGPAAETAVVLGNSRAAASLRSRLAEQAEPTRTYRMIAHARIGLFEMLSAAERIEPLDIDLGILALSEFDLFRAERPRPESGHCRWGAMGASARWLGPRVVFRHRRHFLQLAAACSLESYSTRLALHRAGLDAWREFDGSLVARTTEASVETPPPPTSFFPRAARSTEQKQEQRQEALQARRRLFAEASAAFPELPADGIRFQVRHALRLYRGAHVAYNRRLIERTIDTFLEGGNRVLLVEPPLHSTVRRALDPALRQEFLRYAESLAEQDGVDLLRLEESGPFDDSSFADLTHLHNQRGAIQMTEAIVERIRRMPRSADAQPP